MKTLGNRTAPLITELYERKRTIFTLAEAESITGLTAQATSKLLHQAERRGLVSRLKSGLFTLVPFEMGQATTYAPNELVLAGEIVAGEPYFLSHGTALELHRMVTQPNFVVYVSCPKRMRPKVVGGYQYHFVHTPLPQMFGVTKHWLSKTEAVPISDIERTILDGLTDPQFAGGITEVAKGLWMRHDAVNHERLVDYALRLNIGAVIRRLGFLLDHYNVAPAAALQQLRKTLTSTYQRFDPMLPVEGPYLTKWKLQLNVSIEELDAVRFT